jgi:hypothetical protein
LPYVAEIETSTFNLGVVRYPMVQTSRTNYFGSSRVDNISTLPFSWNYERGVGGGTLGMYFIPDQNYPIKLKAKIFLTDVSLNTDLTYITLPAGQSQTFSAPQLTTAFNATSGNASALVINTPPTMTSLKGQSMCFGQQVQFTGGSIPATLSLSTTYYAVPINQASFYVATSLANAQANIFVPYAAGSGNVISFSLVISLLAPTNLTLGDQIIFTNPTGTVPSGTLPGGLTAGVIYYAVPSSATTFCVATTLFNAQTGTYIPFTSVGTGINTVTLINPNNIPNFTYYSFINNANQGFDTAYIEYLRYTLSAYMCSEYGIMFNPESQRILNSYRRKLMYMDPPDLSMKKLSILQSDQSPGYSWGDVNLGKGYRP